MATQANAYQLLLNGSVFPAVIESYEAAAGVMIWPLLFFITLVLVFLKSDSPANVVIAAIIGNVVLFPLIALEYQVVFYITMALSIAFVLAKFVTKN